MLYFHFYIYNLLIQVKESQKNKILLIKRIYYFVKFIF